MGLGLLDRFLKFTINMQIRVGITVVVLIAILISIALLSMSNIIQYNNFTNYYENIIQDENDKMLLFYEQYIQTVEATVERKAKSDLEFYQNLEKIYFENLTGLELNTLLDDTLDIDDTKIIDIKNANNETINNCYNKDYLQCIIYQFYGDESSEIVQNYKNSEEFKKLIQYYNLIFPLLNSTLSENSIGVYNLRQYFNFQFYKKIANNDNNYIGKILFFAGINETQIKIDYNETMFDSNIVSNIIDNILNIFLFIPNINKKFTLKYIINNFNKEFLSVPQMTSNRRFLELTENFPYKINDNEDIIKIRQNDLSFDSKIFNFQEIDSNMLLQFESLLVHNISNEMFELLKNNISKIFSEKMNDLIIIRWSDGFFGNLVDDIYLKNKYSLDIFSLLYSPFASIKENSLNNTNYFFDETNGIFLTKDILSTFSCMYLVKKEIAKTESDYEKLNSFNINYCNIKFDENFEEYLSNNESIIDIYDRKKVKIDIIKYEIKYTYFTYSEDGKKTSEMKELNFDLENSDDKELSKNKNSYKIFQGIYPLNSMNVFSSLFCNDLIFVNFYFTNLFSNYLDIEIIKDACYAYFYKLILISSAILWAIVLLIIIIIVLKISHSISDPIDKLIQPVPMNDNSSKELNKYFQNISYSDDSTINDLFVLCKKLIIGGFKSDEDYRQKKKNKTINSYNNISLVKSNNMIINEDEIMKGVKKQEIHFFEKKSKGQSIMLQLNNNSGKKVKKINYKVLSGLYFTGKFYQNNKRYLIKDKEYFDILNNEMQAQKKKGFDDNKLKGMKHSILSSIRENIP